MGRVIKFENKLEKEQIERLAFDRFNSIKQDEDLYIVRRFSLTTDTEEQKEISSWLGDVNDYFDTETIEDIKKLDVKEHDKIVIFLAERYEDGDVILEIGNIMKQKHIVLQSKLIDNKLDEENIQRFTGLFATIFENISDVCFDFYTYCNFEELKEMVKTPI